MKVLNKITPYSIKRAVPVLGMAFATMLGGCKKHETPEPKPTPKFERTFVWGHAISAKELSQLVAASADSVQVVKVILQSDAFDWGWGSTTTDLLNKKVMPMVEACSPEGRKKLVHRGTIVRPLMDKSDPETYKKCQADSATLANMGYEFLNPGYTR